MLPANFVIFKFPKALDLKAKIHYMINGTGVFNQSETGNEHPTNI